MVCLADSISIIAFIKHTDDHQNMTLIQVGKEQMDDDLVWFYFMLFSHWARIFPSFSQGDGVSDKVDESLGHHDLIIICHSVTRCLYLCIWEADVGVILMHFVDDLLK